MPYTELLITLVITHICTASTYCNVCRDPPINSKKGRWMVAKKKKFKQNNGIEMTCGELEASVADVRVGQWAAAGENYLCATAQYLAWEHCTCKGAHIPSPEDSYKDPNPACNLCGHSSLQYDHVPHPNKDKLTNTQFGKMNCEGLYLALAEGIVSSYVCPRVTMTSGPECCNIPEITNRKLSENITRAECILCRQASKCLNREKIITTTRKPISCIELQDRALLLSYRSCEKNRRAMEFACCEEC